jgi:polyadenylate-binding protein 2
VCCNACGRLPQPTEESTEGARRESDERSIHIGGVEYTVTEEELKQHFIMCGEIERLMIKKNKFTKKPMGFGYVFAL